MNLFTYERSRLWHWRIVHAWSILRLRRRVVFCVVLIGLIVSIVVTMRTTRVFVSQVLYDVDPNPSPYACY